MRAEFSGTDATANDNVELIRIAEAWRYKRFQIQVTAGVVDVEVSADGITFVGPVPVRNTVGAALAADEINVAAPATATGYLEGMFRAILIRKKGVANPTTVKAIAADDNP